MTDKIEQWRGEQRKVASTIADRIVKQLAPGFEDGELDDIIQGTSVALDREAVRVQWEADIRHDTFVALLGYTDWLATKLYRECLKPKTLKQETLDLPRCKGKDKEAIMVKHQLEGELLESVVAALRASSVALPPIGRVDRGTLHLDTMLLHAWASHYEW